MGFSQSKPLVKVVYSSQLLLSDTDPTYAGLAKKLAEISAKNNSGQGITGILTVNMDDGNCIQVLEGPRDKVEALIAKIAKDKRHNMGKSLLVEIPKRIYPNWGMMYSGTEHYNMLKRLLPAVDTAGAQVDFELVLIKDKKKIAEMKQVMGEVRSSVQKKSSTDS